MSPASDLSGRVPVAAPQWPLRCVVLWVAVGVATLGLAMSLRYLLIEPHDIGYACADTVSPWWCVPREGVVQMHIWKVWGLSGLAGGLLGLVFGWRWAVWLGYVMSLMGLVLYNADFASIGLVLTCLRLPRA